MPNQDIPIHATQLPRVTTVDGVQLREDVLFTNQKGEPDEGRRKRAIEALSSLREILPSLLEKDETVLYVVGTCQAPMGSLEQFLLGWNAYRVSATRLVFTNLRLLHFGMASDKKWKRTVKAVRWGDITEAKAKGWLNRMLQLRYANGTKESYWRLQRKDSLKIKAVLDAVIPQSRGQATAAQGFQSICPDCRAVLTAGKYECASCGLRFKDEKTLLKRTLLIPGGGYMYASMTLLGIVDFFTEGLFTVAAIVSILMAVGIVAPDRDANGRPAQPGEALAAALFFLLLVGLQKGMEYIHGRRAIRTFLPWKKRSEV
ncbi:MAG TPA: hypothetical protein VJY15_04750 [Candidatus Acidoferrum sp.]|nr:hypothetical protein [Candidatus Acidoferrum sp.]